MIHAWVAADGTVAASDPAAAVAAAVAGRRVWIDIQDEREEQVAALLAPLAIHPLVIEDMVLDVNRPKVDNYGPYLYLVIHSARWEAGHPRLREIDVVLGERFLVTYHDGSTRSITAAQSVLERRPELLTQGPSGLLHFTLDLLVDHYLPIMDAISEEIDGLEEGLFANGGAAEHERILRLKRGMMALRRIVGPQRDTVLALTRDEYKAMPAEMRPYLRDVYDRLARVNDLLDTFRDEVATLLELHVSITSNRLNEVIKRLTVIATIGLPLTVVTSYYGMNFGFAEYRWSFGGVYVLGLLAVMALATWAWLRRKRWL
jgi:magnesium transporter